MLRYGHFGLNFKSLRTLLPGVDCELLARLGRARSNQSIATLILNDTPSRSQTEAVTP